jgi:RHS repeat-associated protein
MSLADLSNPAQRPTRYFYGGESQWQVCEEQDGSGDTVATYVYGRYIDEVLQMQRCESTPPCTSTPPADYYYHTDDLYNVMAVTDGAGAVVERYEYDDYGRPTFMNANGDVLAQPPGNREPSPIANPYLFTGRRYDAETAWYHYRTRYLDPAAGRFTTRDIIGIWGDEVDFGNGYAYVANNPQYYLDPTGTSAVAVVLPFAGGAAVADGPFPVGDAIGAAAIAAAAVVDSILIAKAWKEREKERERAKRRRDKEKKARRQTLCDNIYKAYKASCALPRGCNVGMICSELKPRIAAGMACVGGRASWLSLCKHLDKAPGKRDKYGELNRDRQALRKCEGLAAQGGCFQQNCPD